MRKNPSPEEFAGMVEGQKTQALMPGFVRNSMQGRIWSDATGQDHIIEQMERSHAVNAHDYLRARCYTLAKVWVATIRWMKEREMPDTPEVDPKLIRLASNEPREWVEQLPVMKALKSRYSPPEYTPTEFVPMAGDF